MKSQVVLINIYCVAGYFDNVQNVIGGALRGVGINQAPAAVYLICDLTQRFFGLAKLGYPWMAFN